MAFQALLVLLCLGGVARAAEPAWRYEVQAGAGARELTVEATLGAGDSEELSVDDGTEPFVRDVAVAEGSGWRPVAARGTSWFIPACHARGCRLRYRVELQRAAERLGSEAAQRLGAVTQAPPSTWLLHPLHPAPGRDYRFHVTVPPGMRFVSGVRRVAADRYGADVTTLADSPYSAFGPLDVETLPVPGSKAGATLEVAFVPAARVADRKLVLSALARAAEVVGSYLHRFPIDRLLVLVVPTAGDDLHGRTLGGGGATLMLFVGADSDGATLARSWVPAHELVHLAFPTLPRNQLWIAEGEATYVEPLARVRAGDVSAETVWRDLVDGLPQGLPESGDRGLDHTRAWGRIYWGGALFWLLADVEIRERTGNRRSLDDALGAIVAAGGSIAVAWPIERALRIGDDAVGVPVLVPLERKMADAPMPVDLDALWARLGVRRGAGGRIQFDDAAPLAAVRRAITAR